MFKRYAIFYTPPPGPAAEFGAAWLGWDSATGRRVAHPEIPGLDVAALTEVPRRYGFHGTLKAPFRLAEGAREAELVEAVARFAEAHAAVTLDGLAVGHGHRFVAMRPVGDTGALNRLEAAIVRAFDPFRAPLGEADIARRRRAGLSERQDRQMLEWGYPYVFDDFHFHLTLSGPVEEGEGRHIVAALEPRLPETLRGPFTLDAITLMGEDAEGMFHQIHRHALTG
ncbi:DUF1045 domain-containing protein [Oceaniglobus roseus]|uniref:DUF1045 domain-containing protein n=1 Tax=Oceaniglobus roseus TaxID=1737570 RepID=UPI000C7F71D9|nr:DUF1045 domain-containing protein [Kandeliimicrobium roseum]